MESGSFLHILGSRWARSSCGLAAAAFCVFVSPLANGQSTFGTVLGTVKDPSGSVIPTGQSGSLNTGTKRRSTLTKPDGSYEFVNTEVGNYKLTSGGPWLPDDRISDLRTRSPSHGAARHQPEGCVASHHGECRGGRRSANGCLQRRGNQRQSGTDRSSRGHRYPLVGLHQRLLHPDGAAGCTDG